MKFDELEQNILFEDEDLLVINKPAGWVVNRSKTQPGPTVQDWMEEKYKLQSADFKVDGSISTEYGDPVEIFRERGGVVHRLDKDTSGALLLAKNPQTLIALMRQFKDRETKKTYIALVHGKLVPAEGIINLPMDRSETDKFKFAVTAGGRASETQYRVLHYFPNLPAGMHQKKGKSYQGFTLVELTPKTGRTHQIRVHMSAIKHPLVGDSTYAGKKRIVLDREWCPRHFLHAQKLCFTHPKLDKRVCFEAKLSDDLDQVLAKLDPEFHLIHIASPKE